MSKKKQGIERIVDDNGLAVYGEPVTDKLGNEALVHESSVPKEEGGPLMWLSLRRPGEEGAAAVLLDEGQVQELVDRLEAAKEVWK